MCANSVTAPGSKIASVIIVTFVGCGVAAATVASNAMIVLAIPHEYVGVAIGLATTARSVGGSVATTIYTVILSHSVENHLGKDIATALAKTGLPLADVLTVTEALVTSNMTSSALKVASPLILQAGSYALKLSYSRSFRLVYLVSITFGVLGAICSFFTKDIRQRLTAAVDIKLEEGAHIVSHADNTGGHIIHLVNSNEVGITTEK
jgi:low affinity Fe/Cu permease